MKLRKTFIWILILLCLDNCQTTIADPFEWSAGVDSWTVINDWLDLDNPDGSNPPDYAPLNFPGSLDTVYVGNGGTPEISGSSSAASLTVDQNSSLILSAGSLNIINGQEIVGSSGSGTINQSGGNNASLGLTLGQNDGAQGAYIFTSGSINVSSYNENVGYNGRGNFNQSGGTNAAQGESPLILGVNAGSQGIYTLSGGTISLNSPYVTNFTYYTEIIGWGGTGIFNQNGGTQWINQSLNVGLVSQGLFNLTAGSLNVLNHEFIGSGANGPGVFTQTGGTNWIAGFLWIGGGVGFSGTYLMHGGLMNTGDIRTDSGKGFFTMDGGCVNFGNGHWIREAINSNSVANYTITGGILTNLGTGYINVGESGTALLNVGGSAVVSSTASGNNLDFGQNSSGVGTVHVYGDASLSVWDIRTDSGQGTFTQDGGTVNAGGWLRLGINSNSISVYSLNSGNANLNQMAQIGESGTASLNINGGAMAVVQDMNLGLNSGTGMVNLAGGSLSVTGNENIGVIGSGTFNQTGGVNTMAANLTVAGNLGSTGIYNFLGGTCNVSGSVMVNPGGTLTGIGTVSGPVANAGAVSPGNPIGALNVNGSYAQSASGTLNIDIGGTNAGSQYSQCIMMGGASLNGTLNIAFTNGFTPQVGDKFTILTCRSLTGTFITVNVISSVQGLTLIPIYTGTQVTLVATSPALTVVDANPLFLSSVQLPQPITSSLLYLLSNDSTTRSNAAADGITMLLIQFTNNIPGTVTFSNSGASGGSLSNVDGSQLTPSGVHTTSINGQQMAFVLYTVPDTIIPGQAIVTLQSSFTPDGSSTPIQQTAWSMKLIQTPVELVHGLWADDRTWLGMQSMLSSNNITSHRADYFYKNNISFACGPFSLYRGIVNQDIWFMLLEMRQQGIAVTRADVVAHSMGGILTRIDANDQGSHLPENFTSGYIRRVITVDTPHWGAAPAQFLLDVANDSPAFNAITIAFAHPITSGAVQDLSPYYFAALSGGNASPARQPLSLPSVAISSYVLNDTDFSTNLSILYGFVKFRELWLAPSYQTFFQNLLCGNTLSSGDDDMTIAGKLFGGNSNDGVVGLSSEIGGCTQFPEFADTEHTQAPNSCAIETEIKQLLQGSVSAFSSGFPAVTPGDLNSQICSPLVTPNVLHSTHKPLLLTRLIALTAPLNESTTLSGSNIMVVVQPFTNVVLQQVDIFASGNNHAYDQNVALDIVTNSPFTLTIPAPTNFFGPLTITAIGLDNYGNYDVEKSTISILPATNLTLESIFVNINAVGTNLVFYDLGIQQSLDVIGAYSDGVVRDITLGGAGTVYATSAPKVAVVDTNGNVSAVGNGSAQITVSNRGLSANVSVRVNVLPPVIMSIQPNTLQPGANNVTLCLTGMNLGGTTNIAFFRNGVADTDLSIGTLIMGANAANIQIPISTASNTQAGTLTVVIMTAAGNSGQTPTQGNQFFIVPSPVQNFTNLLSFASPLFHDVIGVSTNGEGFSPKAGLVLSGNTMYGTASLGGSAGNGSVFRINTDGRGFTNLHSFAAGFGSIPNVTNSDGAYPVAGLFLLANALYGTTESGGSSGKGTVFRVNTDGTSFTNLHTFSALSGIVSSNSDGALPQGGLVLSGNTLYGTACQGGSFGVGTVFSISTNGTVFRNLYSFTDGNDGGYPAADLVLSDTTLYGTTFDGGNSDAGTVFAINTNGTGFTNLYSFTDGSDGAGPQAGLILSGSVLYGTASQGGSSDYGTVFSINTNGTGFTILYSFAGYPEDGADPVSGLLLSGSTLFGTAQFGGNSDYGTVYAMNTDGTGYITLHNFAGYAGDGAFPTAGLIFSGSTLYGTAESGGSSNYGTLFSVTLVPTSQPQLTISPYGTNVVITWPVSDTVFTLQYTTNLNPPPGWNNVSLMPTVVNGENTVTNSITNYQMFYRLSQ